MKGLIFGESLVFLTFAVVTVWFSKLVYLFEVGIFLASLAFSCFIMFIMLGFSFIYFILKRFDMESAKRLVGQSLFSSKTLKLKL